VVEEAHKLLNREMAGQTTFASIAREMRKYYVTLLIIDQRPSQIYDEVSRSSARASPAGWATKTMCMPCSRAFPGGNPCAACWRACSPRRKCCLLGWGVPMPLPVRSRRYDDTFWKDPLHFRDP
jgi:hypothetical protein